MNYGALETEITARLNQWFLDNQKSNVMAAIVIPETDEQAAAAESEVDKGLALVQFIDSIPLPNRSTNLVSQEEDITIRVYVDALMMRGDGGIYDVLEQCKLALIGYLPQNASSRITLRKFNFLSADGAKWETYMDFQFNSMNVQAFNDMYFDEPIGAPMLEITGTI